MEDITFSLFKGYADTLPAEATLSEIIRMIRQDPTVKLHTLKHRYYASQGNAAAADKEKSSCPCFSVAVRFQGGKRKRHICGWTSVGLVDIDHLEKAALPELLKRIVADPHTLLTYTTISGAGIRILYRMEHDENTLQKSVASPLDENAYLASEAQYRATFLLANDYYARLLGVECDLKCKNSTRLCGLAHDPELFFNPDALPFRAEVVPKIRKRMRNYRLERAVTTARKELEAQGVQFNLGEQVRSFPGRTFVEQVQTNRGTYPCDLCVVAIGVTPNTGLLAGTGAQLAPNGAVLIGADLATSVPNLYAVGDCAACRDGSLRTSSLKVADLEIARTGLTETEARKAGLRVKSAMATGTDRPGICPNPHRITIKLVYEANTRQVLGAQAWGEKNVSARINAIAVAIRAGMTVEALGQVDFVYSSSSCSIWDPVQIVCGQAQ